MLVYRQGIHYLVRQGKIFQKINKTMSLSVLAAALTRMYPARALPIFLKYELSFL